LDTLIKGEFCVFRFRKLLPLAAAIGIILLAGPSRSEAALRLVVTSGATTDVFYASSQTNLTTNFFTINGYTEQIQTLVTNFPGSPALGTMSTTVNITAFSGPGGSTLTTTTDEIVAVAGATEGLQTGANIAAVQGAALLQFSAPSSSPVRVTADTSDSINPSITSGTATTFTRYNGAEVVSEATPLTGTAHQIQSVSAANLGTYTLGQRLVLSGLNVGSTAVNYTGNSSVTAVPAPGGLLLCLSGLPLVGIGQWLRRRRKQA